ncbi:Maf-like protein isoform 2 [Hibiscus syriacus]|uniref:Maf-like protein isoform 2 n=1 Tax=Hibiscus syriacus TaxID=106335 RepID=A0A6A3C3C0_HIBSY|nr:Maf-like protein isoform 2 [Hibiscus syriacus]
MLNDLEVVVYEGVVREKPANEKSTKGEWDRVEIYFHEIPDEIIEKLIEEGAVLHVAGALIIEHPLIMPYVKQVVGTTDSVMGLPKALTEKLIKEVL